MSIVTEMYNEGFEEGKEVGRNEILNELINIASERKISSNSHPCDTLQFLLEFKANILNNKN